MEIFTHNVNPVKSSMHILTVLDYIAQNNFKTANRTEQAKDELREMTKRYIEENKVSEEMKMQILEPDIFGYNCLYYFEKLDAYQLMETTIIDLSMQDVFRGTREPYGHFLQDSNSFKIIKGLWEG